MSPRLNHHQDTFLLGAIRRVILDAFWSRATSTVKGNKNRTALGVTMSELVGLEGPYVQDGPLPEDDHCGYEVEIQIVLQSRRPGKHSKNYTLFDTVRKLRTAYSNHIRGSNQANTINWAMGDQNGRYQRLCRDPCSSFWFYRFMEGCKARMGQDWRPNKAMPADMIVEVLRNVDVRVDDAMDIEERNRWRVFHTVVTVGYCLSLRGREMFMLDLGALSKYNDWEADEEPDHVMIPLRGRVKGERNHREHLLPCVCQTSSGVDVYYSLKELCKMKSEQRLRDGPAISDATGMLISTSAMDDCLVEVLEDLHDEDPKKFPKDVQDRAKIRGWIKPSGH